MTSEERFTKIEGILVELAKGQAQLLESQQGFRTAHMDLEAAQLNTQKSLDRFINETRTRFADVGEKIANLTILVDRLVARDLERGANGHEG
jgi:hypothetical protein